MSLRSHPYRAPWWLPGAHLQTLYAYLFVPRPRVPYRRERWELDDGDFLDLDWIDGPEHAPLVVLFHGLEGNSRGHYAVSLMHALRRRGWRGVVAHFRGCSGEPNRLPRAYHSGDSAEIARVLQRLRGDAGAAPLFAVGVSLGANALLKWLGESGAEAHAWLDAAAAVSPPFDLMAAGRALDRGFNRQIYTRHFLRSLRRKALAMAAQHHLPVSTSLLEQATTLYAFDNLFTAPVHGFRDADDYWTHASCKPWLNSVVVPTLIVHARNDPFLPAEAIPPAESLNHAITLELCDEGGHAGFVSGPFPGRLQWLPQRILHFFDTQLAQRPATPCASRPTPQAAQTVEA